MKKKMIHIRVLEELDNWLRTQSAGLGFSKNDYVNMILVATYHQGHPGVPVLKGRKTRS